MTTYAKMQMIIHWLALPFVALMSLVSGCSINTFEKDVPTYPVIHIQLPQKTEEVDYDVLVNLNNRSMVLSQVTIPANSNRPLQVDLRVGDQGSAKVDVYAKSRSKCAGQKASSDIRIDGIGVYYLNIMDAFVQQPAETCLVQVGRYQSASGNDEDVGSVVSNGSDYIRCEEGNMAACYAHVPVGTMLNLEAKSSAKFKFSSWRRNGSAPLDATASLYTIKVMVPENIEAFFASEVCVTAMFCRDKLEIDPLDAMGVTFNGVSATGKDDAWAVGKTASGRGIVVHYNGTSWKPVGFALPPPTLNDVAVTAPNAAFVAGGQYIYKCTPSGCTPTGISIAGVANLVGLSAAGNMLWVLDMPGDVYAVNLTTTTLEPNHYTSNSGSNFFQIAAVDATRAYVAGGNIVLSCMRGSSIVCTDTMPPTSFYRGVAGLPDGTAWTGGTQSAKGVLRRRDGSGAWSANLAAATQQQTVFSMFYDSVKQRLWAVGDDGYAESWQAGPTSMRAELKSLTFADGLKRYDVFSTGPDTWIVGEQGKIDHYLN